MGAKKANFRLKTSKLSLLLTFVLCFGLGVYLYFGFQPISVDASTDLHLEIPRINLSTPVEVVERVGTTLTAPEVTVGVYQENPGKTLLIGHSSTVFGRLNELEPGDTVLYEDRAYTVSQSQIWPKNAVDMAEVVAGSDVDTLILMTCAGTHLSGDDYSHRLVVVAE